MLLSYAAGELMVISSAVAVLVSRLPAWHVSCYRYSRHCGSAGFGFTQRHWAVSPVWVEGGGQISGDEAFDAVIHAPLSLADMPACHLMLSS